METWQPEGKHSAAYLETMLRHEAERKALKESKRAARRREIPSLARLSAVLAGALLVVALLPNAFGL